jgi:hypothetical protein
MTRRVELAHYEGMEPVRAVVGVACALLAALGIATPAPARADELFVAPDGDDQNAGTMAAPFATIERAQSAAGPGDTVYIRGGEYRFSGTTDAIGVELTKSGQSGQPIEYFAYADELPVLDFFELKPQARVTGIDVRASWVHVRGLELRGVRQLIVGDSWGVRIRGDHNVIERLNVHDCEAPGIFISSGASNLILNCDSHHNYDPLEDGGNADGFGCHSTGGDNVLRGCRAYENSDDGFDFINAAGTCTAEQSWAFRNGYIPNTNMTGANGAGFKSGGYGNPPNTPAGGVPRHVIRGNLAFGNRAIGFYANYHPGGIDFFNNTAFDNPANYDMRIPTGGAMSSHELRNNIALMPGRDIVSFNGGSDDFNSWSLPVDVTAADFTGTDKAQALLPRQADGSLPNVAFLHLVAGSDLIDRGEDVGLPFVGSKPDLGAYELGAVPPGEPIDGGAPAGTAGGSAGSAGIPAAGASGATAPPATAGNAQPAAGSNAPPVSTPGTAGMQAATAGNGAAPSAIAGASAAPGASGGNDHSDSSADGGCGCRVRAAPRSPSRWVLLVITLWLAVRVQSRIDRR